MPTLHSLQNQQLFEGIKQHYSSQSVLMVVWYCRNPVPVLVNQSWDAALPIKQWKVNWISCSPPQVVGYITTYMYGNI